MKRVCLSAITSLALAAAVVACGGNGAAGGGTTPTTPSPTVTVAAITITSASASATTMQLTATARMSDGASRDVTTSAQWSSSNTAVATISSTGLLTIASSGDVDVRATYQGVTGSTRLTLRTAQQRFTLAGVAREVNPGGGFISGAQVKITAGPDAGQTTHTDASGHFQMQVTGSTIALEVTKDGYEPWLVSNFGIDADRQLDVVLYPMPPSNASGKPATARCKDGTWSWEDKLETACKDDGGIAYAVCPGPLCSLLKVR